VIFVGYASSKTVTSDDHVDGIYLQAAILSSLLALHRRCVSRVQVDWLGELHDPWAALSISSRKRDIKSLFCILMRIGQWSTGQVSGTRPLVDIPISLPS
jgi:hypothetical protein